MPNEGPNASQTILQRRIRERMQALGLNPYSAAIKAHLHPDYVRNILRGKAKRPSAERLGQLAEALECSLAYLLDQPEPAVVTEDQDGQIHQAPEPATPRDANASGATRQLPILYELATGSFKRAPEIRRELGFEAATIPLAYQDREQWFEVVRDQSASSIAPVGSLLQVAKYDDSERSLLGQGDVVVVERHMIGPGAAYYAVERTVRIINNRYPDLGLWFFEFATGDEEYWGISDDIFREKDDIAENEEIVSLGALEKLLQSVREIRQKSGSDAPITVTPEEFQQHLIQQRKLRPRVVGKVLRAITPIDAEADFGLIPTANSGYVPKAR